MSKKITACCLNTANYIIHHLEDSVIFGKNCPIYSHINGTKVFRVWSNPISHFVNVILDFRPKKTDPEAGATLDIRWATQKQGNSHWLPTWYRQNNLLE